MKFREIVRFELGLQLRRTSTWIYFAVMLGVIYRVATEGYIGIARHGGFYYNGPFVVASLTMLGGLLGLFVVAAFAGDAAARDVQLRMHPLFYSAPLGKSAYLGGRFVATFMLSALLALAVPIALLIGSIGVDPAVRGPYRPLVYLTSYLFFAIPSAFTATAVMFGIAAITRRVMTAYLGSIILFTVTVVSAEAIEKHHRLWALAKLMDPFGLIVLREMSGAWTPAEKSTVIIGPQGSLVANRLVWIAIALGVLAFTYRRFRMAHPVAPAFFRRWSRHTVNTEAISSAPSAPIAVLRVSKAFGPASRARQTAAIAVESFREVVTGWAALVVAGMIVFLAVLVPSLMNHMGVPLLPTTREMTAIFTSGDAIWMFIPLLTVFYAGELVWRERDAGMSEIADGAPLPEWVIFLGKFLGLGLSLVALQLVMTATAILIQAMLGYYVFELGVYARIMLGIRLIDYLTFAMIAFVVHVVIDQKYIGHLVGIMIYALIAFGSSLGIEYNLFIFGAHPAWSYSDLRGFGPSLVPYVWFKLYWAAWALLLALFARVLWVRGREQGAHHRLREARRRFSRPVARAVVTAAVLVIALGGFVFYNTNVLNDYVTTEEWKDVRAEYERRYGQHEGKAQPEVSATTLTVELYPKRRAADIRGAYRLVNNDTVAIDTVFVTTVSRVQTEDLTFDRPVTRVAADARFGHYAYVLATALQPGDSLRLSYHVRFHPRGFTNTGIDASVSPKATYIEPTDWLPSIGYQPRRELSDAADRKARGLPPRQATRQLGDTAARQERAGRIMLDITVGTEERQTAVAPGRLRRTWTEGGRRYAHYTTDAPVSNDYAIFSAHYAVRKARANGVKTEIVHDPSHTINLDRMEHSLSASLAYMTREFGEYPHGQLRLVEYASDGSSLHAFPVNISYEEGFSLFNADADKRDVDFPFAVVAHEVSHQWWGHVLTPPDMEGSALLTESLAWFSAIAIVEETYGAEHMQRLMDVMRDAYLIPRARADLPLLRAHDWFTGYRKGPFAMYALRAYIGEARVNDALREMIKKYGAGKPPLPTSLDLYSELRAVTPDSLKYLLVDLFEVNTFWKLETTQVTAEPLESGRWRVTLDVLARKEAVDTVGTVSDRPMNDLVEVGVLAEGSDGHPGKPLYLRMHRIRSGVQRITVIVAGKPGTAGIDPRNLLIDTAPDDNRLKVALQ
jgi:ABC-2 type transport system permease protein